MKNLLIIIMLIVVLCGCIDKEEIATPNKAPVVSFTYIVDHNTLFAGGVVAFNSTAIDEDNDILIYFWDFDDGEFSSETNPVHQYFINGSYTIKLTVNDTKNATTKTETILVGNIAPIAGFTWSAVNTTVTFTDASTDINKDNLTFAWDFNEDGLTDNETAGPIIYTFEKTGSYNVTLKVIDFWGLVDTDTQIITVHEGF